MLRRLIAFGFGRETPRILGWPGGAVKSRVEQGVCFRYFKDG